MLYDPRPSRDHGIALLDERGPADWRSKIDLNVLDMASSSTCVLGQLYGSYVMGQNPLGLMSVQAAIRSGFQVPFDDAGSHEERDAWYTQLTESWREALLVTV